MTPTSNEDVTQETAGGSGARLRWLSTARACAFTLAAVALLIWIATLVYELNSAQPSASQEPSTGNAPGTSVSGDELLEMTPPEKGEKANFAYLLPTSIPGWLVQGPQTVPGTNGSTMEAVYTPRSDELSLVTPVVVYVQIRKMSSVTSAKRVVKRVAMRRYPVTPSSKVRRADPSIIRRLTRDSRSYFVGWAHNEFAVGVDATFAYFVPKRGARSILSQAAEQIVKAVRRSIRNAASG